MDEKRTPPAGIHGTGTVQAVQSGNKIQQDQKAKPGG